MASPAGPARYTAGVPLDPDACYLALRTRDARFDGHFFIGVRTTGVYCRPVCPARTPKRENCLFLPCAAAAREAGFRPCLRCRPEASPGTPAWRGTSATVARALRLIDAGALDSGGVDALADRLGVGARQLRRLFLEHLGATPLAVAQTRRLHFAKKLIDETALPFSEIAFAAGFSSIRRFNDAVRSTWERSPRDLRRAGAAAGAGSRSAPLELRLPFRPPYDWDALAGFFALRAIPGVEVASAERYVRSFRLEGASGTLDVTPRPGGTHLVARLYLDAPAALIRIHERLRRQFDLGADPLTIAEQLGRDPVLAPLVDSRPGLRVPGAWDGFEVAVRAILGQQVSVRGAATLAGRLVEAYGDPLPEAARHPDGAGMPGRLFPRPEALLDLDAARIGLPRARAAAVATLARAVRDGRVDLEGSRDLESTVAQLRALPGIGEWTAQSVAMRALQEPDAFPHGDLGLRRALGRRGALASAAEVYGRGEAWRPWRAYAAVHLWHGPEPGPRKRRASGGMARSMRRETKSRMPSNRRPG
jgi:AraC family transcriptional regulator of adaptative response / DNA-3-methyladenine glycosylase II